MAKSFCRSPNSGPLTILMASAWLMSGSGQLPVAQEGAPTPPGPVKVEIRKEDGGFRLDRGGQPYFIRGGSARRSGT